MRASIRDSFIIPGLFSDVTQSTDFSLDADEKQDGWQSRAEIDLEVCRTGRGGIPDEGDAVMVQLSANGRLNEVAAFIPILSFVGGIQKMLRYGMGHHATRIRA